MKKLIVMLIALVALSSTNLMATGGNLGSGNGTAGSPFLIEDFDDFQAFCDNRSYWSGHVRLDCILDLDPSLEGRLTYKSAPISPSLYFSGFNGTPFTGSFDGNGNTVRNLTISGGAYCGFIGNLDTGSEIKNLELVNLSIETSHDSIGGLAGCNSGSIIDCYSSGAVTGDRYVGGLVGVNYEGNVTDSSSVCDVIGDEYVGGLIGRNETGSVIGCYSTGTVQTGTYNSYDRYVGGLVGHNLDGNITNCYSTGAVSGGYEIGGLIGYNKLGSILDCYSTGQVDGYSGTGGLLGYNEQGSVTKCYSTGQVNGEGYYNTGGLVGWNKRGSVVNCYSLGEVTDSGNGVGGLVGRNDDGDVLYCYSIGTINGGYQVGGIVGWNTSGTVTNSYFYFYGKLDSALGNALNDAQLLDKSSFIGFDFAGDSSDGNDDHWVIEPGYMPRLSWQHGPGFEAPYRLDTITTTLSGTGYPDEPFIIASFDDLMEFRANPSLRFGHYSLTCDIDLSGTTYSDAFIPGSFCGSFSGNGYTLTNLTIDGESLLGFFSRLYGHLDNLGLENISITGSNDNAGSLAGYNSGDISNCHATGVLDGGYSSGGLVGWNERGITRCYFNGEVDGEVHVGGLVGYSSDGSIINSYSTGTVNGSFYYVGGLIGKNFDSYITNCYSTTNVNGRDQVGGLIGWNDYGSVTDCYSTGEVNGSSETGGHVGLNSNGTFTDCFWDVDTSSIGNSGDNNYGATGKTTTEMQMQSTFTDSGWDFVIVWGVGQNQTYPYLKTRLTADLNYDGTVNLLDFAIFSEQWMAE